MRKYYQHGTRQCYTKKYDIIYCQNCREIFHFNITYKVHYQMCTILQNRIKLERNYIGEYQTQIIPGKSMTDHIA